VLLGVVVALGLGGCGGPVGVDPPQPGATDAAQCRALIARLPTEVESQRRRDVTPSGALAAAWGDPPIVLRCGVATPAALTPTSFCLEVSGVGWLPTVDGKEDDMTHPPDGTAVFTTIGRSPNVELSVPSAYSPQPEVLPAFANAIRSSTTLVSPCR
jgi:uncharacterized protein DUF3515